MTPKTPRSARYEAVCLAAASALAEERLLATAAKNAPEPEPPQQHFKIQKPTELSEKDADVRFVSRGLAHNAIVADDFTGPLLGHIQNLGDRVGALEQQADAVHRGDFAQVETLLLAQAVSLNSIFARCVNAASPLLGNRNNTQESAEMMERFMKLGLRAQNQCRSTLETLALLKNPTMVFARQANVAHGPQQVNNMLTSREMEQVARAHGKIIADRTY